jgi:hypothetical protein
MSTPRSPLLTYAVLALALYVIGGLAYGFWVFAQAVVQAAGL